MILHSFLYRTTKLAFLYICMFCFAQKTIAQCATPINTFPYTEGFETTNGNWTTGGTLTDWTWGTPTKPVINRAATGSKCWVVGGLTGSSYNDGELSWLQSPCFDFTGLQYPYISFNVFWEMERRFDGAGFQYSTDMGATWANVGSINEPVNCLNSNWFNYPSITYLNGLTSIREGWSGNIQSNSGSCQGGGGSGGWVIANHTMPSLAGIPKVIFRFIFGAGTQCNAYDGFAIDDISIGEAPPNKASFTSACNGNLTVDFTNTSDLCPSLIWNFGDFASGANNSSTLANPSHTFSAPGSYFVTLMANGPGNAPSITAPKQINVLGSTTTVLAENNCANDNNGSATVVGATLALGPFAYSWNTTPAQNSQTITGLAGGTYTVTVSALNACPSTATAVIASPAALNHVVNITQPGCTATTGSATITESGGTGTYSYVWTPAVSTGPSASGLTPGQYSVTVTDSKSCTDNFTIDIITATPPNVSITNKKDESCAGLKDGSATVSANGGAAPYTFSWSTIPAQTTATATNLAAGMYAVTVTDNNGCTATTSAQINATNTGFCGEVFFPNAFTPDGNSVNDNFGVMGNVTAVSDYLLLVYNRFGELIFYTRNPLTRWNGFYKGKQLSGTYVWAATYTFKSQFKKVEQGTVTIIR